MKKLFRTKADEYFYLFKRDKKIRSFCSNAVRNYYQERFSISYWRLIELYLNLEYEKIN